MEDSTSRMLSGKWGNINLEAQAGLGSERQPADQYYCSGAGGAEGNWIWSSTFKRRNWEKHVRLSGHVQHIRSYEVVKSIQKIWSCKTKTVRNLPRCGSASPSLGLTVKVSVDPFVISWPGFNSEARPEDQTQTEMMSWKQEEITSHSADLRPNTSVLQKTREHNEISHRPGCIWGKEPKNRKASNLTTACVGEALYLQNLNLSHAPWCWDMPKQEKTASMEIFCLLSSIVSEAVTIIT